ncbi:MAG: CARDB domain-containing protein [Candidatus Methanoperedens sp.]|nr:CARDB domain-containing protein [Candidatus Methanoperedens nitroreducens]MDJ1422371.1 CARDB domain-containing protein [Candidatus Methanoperedens sp.]
MKIAVIDGGSLHEAKVMDVIRSISPDAQITNYSGNWLKGIENARGDAVDIISVSLAAPHLRLDDDNRDLYEQIKFSRQNGTLYINSAGNYANLHYMGTFQDSDNDGMHEFSTGLWRDETLDVKLSKILDGNISTYLYLDPQDADKLDIRAGGIELIPVLNLLYPVIFENPSKLGNDGVKWVEISTNRSISDIYFLVTNATGYNSSDVIGTPFHIFVYPEAKEIPLINIKVDGQHRWIDHPVQESSISAPGTSKYSFTVGATYSNLVKSYSDKVAFLAAVSGIIPGQIPPALAIILDSLAIGDTFPQDDLAYFSSQGPVYDAAGNSIIKPDIVAPTFVSTDNGIFGGTSASAPHVAGAAALLLSANPNLTADQVQQVIEESAVDLGEAGKDNKYGAGRIDIYEAVKRVTPDLEPSNIQVIPDIVTKGQNITLKADVRNTGYWDAQNIEMQFLKNGTIINASIIPVLKAGNMVTIETKWVPDNLGSYNISVSVDPGNRVPESNKSNNYVSRIVTIVPLPDFVMSPITLSTERPVAYTPFYAYASIYNEGTDTDTLYYVYVTATLNSAQASAWVPVFSGGRTDLSVEITWYPGTYTLTLTADPLDYIREIDETNNAASKTFTIFPSLTISSAEQRNASLNISYKETKGLQKK